MQYDDRALPWAYLIVLGVLGACRTRGPSPGSASPSSCSESVSGSGGSASSSSGGSTGGGGSGTAPEGLSGTSMNGGYKLDADRATVWTTAGMLAKGGIPSATWPACNATPLAPNGWTDDSAAINNLVQSCAPGTVVQLGPGT